MVKTLLTRANFLFLLPCLILFLSSCGETTPTFKAMYQPPFAPVTFSIDSNGNISVQGNLSIETPIGTFTLSAGVSERPQPDNNTLLLIIRHKQDTSLVDSYYRIQTGQEEVIIVTNGTTTIDVTSQKVSLDASKGTIQSLEVRDTRWNNETSASPTLALPPSPTPSPTPTPGLTIASAAKLIIQWYDEQGPYASAQLIKRITSMMLPEPQGGQIVSCVAYENAELDYPEQVYGTWTREFTLQFSASGWTVISMGSEDCTVTNGETPPPQMPIGTPPALNQVASSIKDFYDKDWHGFYVMDALESMADRQQIGNYIGACVYYAYHAPSHPEEPEMYFHAEFGFKYANGAWNADSWDQMGCGPHYNN